MKNGSGDGFARKLEKSAAVLVPALLCCFLLGQNRIFRSGQLLFVAH